MNPNEMLSVEDQKFLLQLARNTIRTTLQKGRRLPTVESLSPIMREKRGVFVTLWSEDGLRGCIGLPYPIKPLVEAVQEAANSAAFGDPRFPPLLQEEFSSIEIEISVLTVPKKIEPSKVKVGVHGLIVSKGHRSGLLLPQVATEYRMDREEFISQTCVKAGLPADAWREKVELSAFEAQVFAEVDLQKK